MLSGSALNLAFAALADPTRRAILLRLAEGQRTVNEIAAPFRISLPAISRHLKVLERASLITRRRDGRRRVCRLSPSALNDAADWLAFHQRFWNESLERLEADLSRSKKIKEERYGTDRARRRRK